MLLVSRGRSSSHHSTHHQLESPTRIPTVQRSVSWGASVRPQLNPRHAPAKADTRGISFGVRTLPRRSNQRMKLSGRGGHFWRKSSVLFVAAPARSLCAIR